MRLYERGQTLPIHAGLLIAFVSSLFMIYDWSTVFQLEVKVQTDADLAAKLAVLPQVTQFNQTEMALYATNIEEYRLRGIVESILLSVRESGGCDQASTPNPAKDYFTQPGASSPQAYNCMLNYASLRPAYITSLARYTDDALMLDTVANVTAAQQASAAQQVVAQLENTQPGNVCSTYGDCAAMYYFDGLSSRGNLGTVKADSISYALAGADTGATTTPTQALTPQIATVAVCENVTNLLPTVFGKPIGPLYIFARSSATPVAITQEWMQPGLTINAATNAVYQPNEFWGDSSLQNSPGYFYNDVDFGGNTSSATIAGDKATFQTKISNGEGEFAAYIPWWDAALDKNFSLSSTQKTAEKTALASQGCKL